MLPESAHFLWRGGAGRGGGPRRKRRSLERDPKGPQRPDRPSPASLTRTAPHTPSSISATPALQLSS